MSIRVPSSSKDHARPSKRSVESTRLPADDVARSERPAFVIAHAVRVFRDESSANRWLAQPNMALGEARPWDLLTTERWRDVDDVLGRIEHGIVN